MKKLLVSCLLLVACGGGSDHGDLGASPDLSMPGPDLEVPDDLSTPTDLASDLPTVTPDFAFTLDPATPTIGRFSSKQFLISVARAGGFDGDVAITLDSAPSGITMPLVTIAGTSNAGLVTISVGDVTPATIMLQLTATSGALSHVLVLPLVVRRGHGELDTSFATAGHFLSATGHFVATPAISMQLQADGKLVVGASMRDYGAGALINTGADDFLLFRLSGAGVADTSGGFGTFTPTTGFAPGNLVTDFLDAAAPAGSYSYDDAASTLIDPTSGNLYQLGSADGSALGTPIPLTIAAQAFDSTGARLGAPYLYPGDANKLRSVRAAALRPSDGTIFVVGALTAPFPSTDIDLYIATFTPALAVGLAPLKVPQVSAGAPQEIAQTVLVQQDRMLVAMTASNAATATSGSDVVLRRFLDNGNADTTFGNQGMFLFDTSMGTDSVREAAIAPDGGILLVGRCAGISACVMKVLADGSALDPAFGVGGWMTLGVADGLSFFTPRAIAAQADGGILVVGTFDVTTPSSRTVAVLARVTAAGKLDTDFGDDGFVIETGLTGAGRYSSIVVQPDGKIVTAGSSNNDVLVSRYYP